MSECPPQFLRVEESGDDASPFGARCRIIDNRHAVLRWELERRHVSPEIIDRVIRLNPTDTLDRGRPLRGFHYKPGPWWGFPRGLVQKGDVLRKHGREVWADIPRSEWRKNGRRVFVSYHAARRAAGRP